MAEMLSPGVFVTEIDASTIVPTVSNSVGIFAGDFVKGPVGSFTLITSVADLITFYGKPTNKNYNDFYQAYNFLQYGNKLLLSRAADMNGTVKLLDGVTAYDYAPKIMVLNDISDIEIGSYVKFGEDTEYYQVIEKGIVDDISGITIDREYEGTILVESVVSVSSFTFAMNGVFEATDSTGIEVPDTDYVKYLNAIGNYSDFENSYDSIAFAGATSKLKFIARNVGQWSEGLEICIAKSSAFGTDGATYAFEGIGLDDLFEYAPIDGEFGIVVKLNDDVVETFTVSFDETAKDHNQKSLYVENVINTQSSYIFAKDNAMNNNPIADYAYKVDGVELDNTIELLHAQDSAIGVDDIADAMDLFSNKEELDIDIVIANELDAGVSAKNLVETREDCIGFIGANYVDAVGKKAAEATSKLIDWRMSGAANFNSMFVVACGNYKYQYDRYNDKYRWINIAGDIAGLRAQTSTSRASWWASAGIERGQVKNVTKLAFNPDMGMRDMLYKNGINPVVSFPGLETPWPVAS
jgi:hypothetical protein